LKPSPDDFVKAFRANAPADVQALREHVTALAQSTDEKLRQETIEDLHRGLDAFAAEAARAQLQSASRLASALQGMFKKSLEQSKRSLPSALGAATAALDLLNDLCAGGHNPDLAEPPVRVLVVDDDPIAADLSTPNRLQYLIKRDLDSNGVDSLLRITLDAPRHHLCPAPTGLTKGFAPCTNNCPPLFGAVNCGHGAKSGDVADGFQKHFALVHESPDSIRLVLET
jgi:hypothetical protein